MGKTVIFFLSTQTEQRRGLSGAALSMRPAALPGTAVAGSGGGWGARREDLEGNSFRSSPQVGTACGERSTAAGGLQAEAALVAVVGARGRETEVPGRCLARRRAAPAIYRRGKTVSRPGEYARGACACQSMEVRPARSNGGRRDVSGIGAVDVTRRAATWWPASWQ
jgi:hypothetical protein